MVVRSSTSMLSSPKDVEKEEGFNVLSSIMFSFILRIFHFNETSKNMCMNSMVFKRNEKQLLGSKYTNDSLITLTFFRRSYL